MLFSMFLKKTMTKLDCSNWNRDNVHAINSEKTLLKRIGKQNFKGKLCNY